MENKKLITPYLKRFKEQIKDSKENSYIIFKLDNNNEVDKLTEYLQNPYVLDYRTILSKIIYFYQFYIKFVNNFHDLGRKNNILHSYIYII